MPTTMNTYILGIQRVFNEWGFELKLTTGPVFGNPKTGLISVLNNKFSEQQSRGMASKSHNVLPLADVKKLLLSPSCSQETPQGYSNKPSSYRWNHIGCSDNGTALTFLGSIRRECCGRKQCPSFYRENREYEGASKTQHGGWKSAGEKPTQITMFLFFVYWTTFLIRIKS